MGVNSMKLLTVSQQLDEQYRAFYWGAGGGFLLGMIAMLVIFTILRI
jgi:hypothetical protein